MQHSLLRPLVHTLSLSRGTLCVDDRVARAGSAAHDEESCNKNFKVVIRVRPPLKREVALDRNFQSSISVSEDHKVCTAVEYLGAETDEAERLRDINDNPKLCQYHSFKFDYVYDIGATQASVYENTARPAVLSALEGYNATILAYGQTGTGKTYTMEGFQYFGQHPDRGIVPRTMEEVFNFIGQSPSHSTTFMVRASYLQIYNEVVCDLLKNDRANLSIREDKRRGVFVEGLSEWAVRSPSEIYNLMRKGTHSRVTASTKLNDLSTRLVGVIPLSKTKVFRGSGPRREFPQSTFSNKSTYDSLNHHQYRIRQKNEILQHSHNIKKILKYSQQYRKKFRNKI